MAMVLCWDSKDITMAEFDKILPFSHFDPASVKGLFPKKLTVRSRKKPRDFMEVGGYLFVSNKVKALLEHFNAEVEAYPVTVVFRKKEIDGWHYLHLLAEADCLDHEKTTRAGRESSMPEMVKHMVLKDSACEGAPFFWIATTTQIGVSDELAATFRIAKCTGVNFCRPEEWKNRGLFYD
jgi:hypothetical protein